MRIEYVQSRFEDLISGDSYQESSMRVKLEARESKVLLNKTKFVCKHIMIHMQSQQKKTLNLNPCNLVNFPLKLCV